MIAIDTQLLVYASVVHSPWHRRARQAVDALAESHSPWAIPWPCIHEYIRNVTDPRLYSAAASLSQAFAAIRQWDDSPGLVLIGEGPDHLDVLEDLASRGRIVGARIHDARIAAICIQNGVSELWTADRDFSAFPRLRTRNPLVA